MTFVFSFFACIGVYATITHLQIFTKTKSNTEALLSALAGGTMFMFTVIAGSKALALIAG